MALLGLHLSFQCCQILVVQQHHDIKGILLVEAIYLLTTKFRNRRNLAMLHAPFAQISDEAFAIRTACVSCTLMVIFRATVI